MPVVGSSRNSTRGSPIMASAMDRRRFIPPLSSHAFFKRCGHRLTRTRRFSTTEAMVEGTTQRMAARMRMCWRTVSCGQRMLSWLHTPRICCTCDMSSRTLSPHTYASPNVGAYSPVSTWMVVVLPAPLWPRRQKHSLLFITTVSSLTAVVPLKSFVSFTVRMDCSSRLRCRSRD